MSVSVLTSIAIQTCVCVCVCVCVCENKYAMQYPLCRKSFLRSVHTSFLSLTKLSESEVCMFDFTEGEEAHSKRRRDLEVSWIVEVCGVSAALSLQIKCIAVTSCLWWKLSAVLKVGKKSATAPLIYMWIRWLVSANHQVIVYILDFYSE